MKMKKNIFSFFLASVIVISLILPVNAEEKISTSEFTLKQIQDLAVKNSRTLEELDYLTDQVQHSKYIYRNAYRKTQSKKIGGNIIASSASSAVEQQMKAIEGKIGQNLSNDAVLKQLYANPIIDMGGKKVDLTPTLNTYSLLKMQSEIYNKANGMSNDIVTGQMELMKGLGVAGTDSILRELKDKKENAEDTLEDLERAKKDADEQTKQLATLLTFETSKLEKNIKLLEEVNSLYLKLANVEKIKLQNGLSNDAEVKKVGIEASNYSKQLKFAKNSLKILKGKLNDLLGRRVDAPLHVVEFTVNGPSMAIPSYENIIDDALENTYDFHKHKRSIKNIEHDIHNVDGSNEKDIKKKEIKKEELNIEKTEVDVRTNIKTLRGNLEEKAKAYQLANVNLEKAKQELDWKKLECENELASPLMLQGTNVEYLKAESRRRAASYDYYLAKNELDLAVKGIYMPDDYNLAKEQFAKANI